ncbi:Transcription factor GTE9 [Cardamine amara subsp. amara]|uniref:Transcription factor GTE9 n=1 Tax=Cardamine amara subsp. amara TaxID=228776 RepID=A0ABD1AI60_CARAN
MSQIERRRRKGRPSKADLARRRSSSPGESGYELRRGQRRRNVRYNFDFDDYLDEEEEEELEEEKRRQKKLKQVLKLNQSRARADPPIRSRARVSNSSDYEEEEEDEDEAEEDDGEDTSEKRQVKKRKLNRHEEEGEEEEKDYEEEGEEEEEDRHFDSDDKEFKRSASVSGTHSSEPTPILDKKSLELILDKLQKKDIYGVYAEPVDPEELPDYHDIIENPMDFSTVRKKLANGSYHTLEELESDVLLICSNAMQYNSSDTVYYKQARTIQEMGNRKFEKARIKIKRAEKELKTDEKVKPGSSVKKQVRQPFSRNGLDPVGSDFSSGANLASGGASQNEPVSTQIGGHEKHSYTDVLFEGNTSLVDNNLEKAEDLSSGKGLFGKCVRKLSVAEEDSRATYGNSDQLADRSESIFTTFESEIKQFVAVGLHAEHAYGRSLARFAATLGPVAWKIASQRIEQALPADFKFGRGWVGEYEPLPTPVLLFETCTPKEPPKEASVFLKPQSNAAAKKNETLFKTPVPAKELQGNRPVRDGNRAFPFPTSIGAVSEGSPSFVTNQAGNLKSLSQQEYRNPSPLDFVKPQNRIPQQVELNLPPPAEQTNSGSPRVSETRSFEKSDRVASFRSSSDMMRNVTPTDSEHYKRQMTTKGIFPGGLSNGKVSSGVNNRMFDLSTDSANQMGRTAASSQQPMRQQSQSHGEQAQLMRNFSEKARTQHNSAHNHPKANTPHNVSSTQPARSEDSSNASAAAARAWMSIGAGGNNKQTFENPSIQKSSQISAESLYNPSREQLHHHQAFKPRDPEETQFHHQRNGFPFQTFVHQPVHGMMNGGYQPFQNNRPTVYPQMAAPTSDFTRFHVQSPWRGGSTPHVQLKQRQENLNLPPDLNIGVHSPDSPAKQSSGVRVDSQQPDLALQL